MIKVIKKGDCMKAITDLEKCLNFLKKNGYVDHSEYCGDLEFTIMSKNADTMTIDINKDEIVLIDDSGDFLHLPCNYYALIGALIHFSQISIGYAH